MTNTVAPTGIAILAGDIALPNAIPGAGPGRIMGGILIAILSMTAVRAPFVMGSVGSDIMM
jgi:hypothetical protein